MRTGLVGACVAAALVHILGIAPVANSLHAELPSIKPPADPKARAISWISEQAEKATGDVRAREDELWRAEGAVIQAEKALALAQEYRDAAAEQIARGALLMANQAVAAAQAKVASARSIEARMKALLQNIEPGAIAFATFVSGNVNVCLAGRCRTWNGFPIALAGGNLIQAGSDGFATVTLENGKTYSLQGGDRIEVLPVASENLKSPLGQRVRIILKNGAEEVTLGGKG